LLVLNCVPWLRWIPLECWELWRPRSERDPSTARPSRSRIGSPQLKNKYFNANYFCETETYKLLTKNNLLRFHLTNTFSIVTSVNNSRCKICKIFIPGVLNQLNSPPRGEIHKGSDDDLFVSVNGTLALLYTNHVIPPYMNSTHFTFIRSRLLRQNKIIFIDWEGDILWK
jgi:hypothetical protein